jgi:suppressor of G2 allele of SKP1
LTSSSTKHNYYNSAKEVVVTVFTKGVAPKHVSVEFSKQTLIISIEVPSEMVY